MRKCMTEAQFEKWMRGRELYAVHPFGGGYYDEPLPKSAWKEDATVADISEAPAASKVPWPKKGKSATRFYKSSRAVTYDKRTKRFCVEVPE